MTKLECQSLGGKATAFILRNKALVEYYKNPKICLYCNKIIEVLDRKVSMIKQKKFCNSSCAGRYNNRNKPKIIKIPKDKIDFFPLVLEDTKGEIFKRRSTWQSARSLIQKHARKVFFKNNDKKACHECGYSNYIEVCHIKSVSDFKDTDKLKDINAISNLIGLCPNHHWEFDNNILKIRCGTDSISAVLAS